jgi:hypothetical protein
MATARVMTVAAAVWLTGCPSFDRSDYAVRDGRDAGGSGAGAPGSGVGGTSGAHATGGAGATGGGLGRGGALGGSGGTGAIGSGGATNTGGLGAAGGSSSGGTPGDGGPACLTDLSGVGTGDFRIEFTLTTTTTGVQMSLVEQLVACIACGGSGVGWAVTMTPTGAIAIETSDGTPSHRVFNIGGGPVNDGLPHRVIAGRSGGMLWVRTDGGAISPLKSDPYPFGVLPPLTKGLSPCGSSACTFYQSLSGSVADICVSRSDAGTCDAGASCGGGSGGSSSGGAGGSSGACPSGTARCSGTIPTLRQTCVAGAWVDDSTLCSGSTPICFGGACVACNPGTKSCVSTTQPQTCSASGAWVPETACSGTTPVCSSAGVCATCFDGCPACPAPGQLSDLAIRCCKSAGVCGCASWTTIPNPCQ